MSLTPRQRRFYTDSMKVYQPIPVFDVGGKRTGETYEYVETVSCYFEIRSSVESPSVIGSTEGDNSFSRDSIHCADDLVIDTDWWVVNVTLNGDGTQSFNYGRFWVIVGQPKSISQRGRRRAQKRECQAIQLQKAPSGVTV